MKATYPGTCSICTLGYRPAEEIVRTPPREVPTSGRRTKTVRYAHRKCELAQRFTPERREALPCPRCDESVEWRHLGRHLSEEHFLLDYQVRFAMRRILYDRAGLMDLATETGGQW
jgi:hypothetical protein